MDKVGWKVVCRAKNGHFQSARIKKSWWCISYAVGKRSTGRHGTPVLAFSTRADARVFKDREDLIFKANLENPRPITRIAYWLRVASFASFWYLEGRKARWKKQNGVGSYAPDGTLACDAITLLELS